MTDWSFINGDTLNGNEFLSENITLMGLIGYDQLTPIWYISGISRSVISEKKSKIYFLISDDVIHGRVFMKSHKSETTPVRLPLCHMI